MKDYTESYLVEFDANLISYQRILEKWKSISSPYPTDRQYRTAIFFANKNQEETARSIAGEMENVDIEPATRFYMAEERHQNFLDRL
jgi:peptide methionine sulfoxide reductase MsrA